VELSIFQIDAFADRVFGGNPAAICPLDSWVPDDVMQAIAAENNLAETAFFVAADSKDTDGACYDLRWFTPTLEVELCGHATLASAFLIFERFAPDAEILRFRTRSGELTVTRQEGQLFLDFPSYSGPVVDCPDAFIGGLGKMPQEVIEGPNYMAVKITFGGLAYTIEANQPQVPRKMTLTLDEAEAERRASRFVEDELCGCVLERRSLIMKGLFAILSFEEEGKITIVETD